MRPLITIEGLSSPLGAITPRHSQTTTRRLRLTPNMLRFITTGGFSMHRREIMIGRLQTIRRPWSSMPKTLILT